MVKRKGGCYVFLHTKGFSYKSLKFHKLILWVVLSRNNPLSLISITMNFMWIIVVKNFENCPRKVLISGFLN